MTTLFWTGATDNNWDAGNTQNWTDTTVATTFSNQANVNFVDGALNQNISLAANVSPGAIAITNNAGNPYSFNGAGTLSSVGTLTKSGVGPATFGNSGGDSFGTVIINAGTLTFANTNSIGTLIVNGGTLQIPSARARQREVLDRAAIADNGAVVIDRSDVLVLGNVISGSGSLVQIGTGTTTLSATNSYTGGTNVQSGTLMTATNFSNGTLAIAGATARVAQRIANDDPAGRSVIPAISITGGTLDLTNNVMVIDYTGASPLATIRGLLTTGYANGAWTGPGINSSAAASKPATALGYAEASTVGANSLAGPTDSTSVIVAYTLTGDANLDGVVNTIDFNMLAADFNSRSGSWTGGDFNYDGVVNAEDFDAIARNYGQVLPTPAGSWERSTSASFVEPCLEPTSVAVVFSACSLFSRRRKRRGG